MHFCAQILDKDCKLVSDAMVEVWYAGGTPGGVIVSSTLNHPPSSLHLPCEKQKKMAQISEGKQLQ